MEHRCGYSYFYQASEENMSSREKKGKDFWVGREEKGDEKRLRVEV